MTPRIKDNRADWPPERSVFPLRDVTIRVLDGPHPVAVENSEAIAENWRREIAANPALYDGRMLFQDRVSIVDRKLASEAFLAPFSAFLWWRRQAERPPGRHVFSYPVLESADGALVAIRMGRHTANPGQVYFASGSLEAIDVVNGICDVDANMRREVREETGLDLAKSVSVGGFHASHLRSVVTLFRVYRFDMTAADMVSKIEANMPIAEDQEIAGAVAIRTADPAAHKYNIAMLPILDWYFASVRN